MRYKFLIPISLSIVIGLFFGKIFFNNIENPTIPVFSEKNRVYMLQTGVYKTLDSLKENHTDYNKLLIEKEDDGYHLYVGVAKSYKIADKIKDYYESKNYSIYIKEKTINSDKFLSILGEYDKIIEITEGSDLPGIERIVISNYKEMVEDEN